MEQYKISGGLLIVFGGTDGTGKNTESQFAEKWFADQGYIVHKLSFPRYNSPSGWFVTAYLGRLPDNTPPRYGPPNNVDPKIASEFYALDRYDASFEIKRWLAEGDVVICDRYVESNAGHQGGKITDPEKRKEFVDWLFDREYNFYQIPKPDINIILWLPPELVEQRITGRGNPKGHEVDPQHLINAGRAYRWLTENYPGFTLVECCDEKGANLDTAAVDVKVRDILEGVLKTKIGQNKRLE
jgi:dTMP kinase